MNEYYGLFVYGASVQLVFLGTDQQEAEDYIKKEGQKDFVKGEDDIMLFKRTPGQKDLDLVLNYEYHFHKDN